jgi:hypothetical protein
VRDRALVAGIPTLGFQGRADDIRDSRSIIEAIAANRLTPFFGSFSRMTRHSVTLSNPKELDISDRSRAAA